MYWGCHFTCMYKQLSKNQQQSWKNYCSLVCNSWSTRDLTWLHYPKVIEHVWEKSYYGQHEAKKVNECLKDFFGNVCKN